MNKLPELLDQFQNEVPGFVSTDVVEIDSGMSIGGESIDPEFDSDMASASYAEVVKSNRRALDLLGMDDSATEDILITTEQVYLLLRELGDEYYHGLAISREGNLGMARMLMKKYAPKFLEAIEM
jgi:predicted regulator of Ras-like GTPase activity (Roadblock/LC7/MglB family)